MNNGTASIFSRLKRWHIAVIAFAILVASMASIVLTVNPFGLNPFAGEDQTALAPTERLLPVRIDTLTTEIAINGGIAFSNKEDLTFGSPGYVSEILVTEGEIVTEGQPLASLDPESVANLRRAITQAQLDYEDALDALADAKNPTLQIAEAEAALADAELQVEAAQDDLEALLNPGSDVIAQAESALADAELQVQNAGEALHELVNPSPDVIAQAREAVAEAQVTLQDSQHSLDNDFLSAQTELEIAERELSVVRMLLDSPENTNELEQVRDNLSNEEQDYANVIYKWTGVTANDDDLAMAPGELFDALEFDTAVIYSREYALFEDDNILDNPDTRWNELKVFGWRGLYPGYGQIEFQCDNQTLLPERLSDTTNTNSELCIERDFDNAWEALKTARDELQHTEAKFDEAIAELKQQYEEALDSVSAAQDKVDRLQSDNTGGELLRKKFASARENLAKLAQDLEDLLNPNEAQVTSLSSALALAKATHDDAKSALHTILDPEQANVFASRYALELALARRDKAAHDVQEIHDRRELQVALQEASVAAAQAKVEGETRRFEDSTLNAPWDGYITSIPVEVGQEIEPFEVVLTVINSGIVNVEGSVDEIDVLSLRREEPVTVTIDALPDQELDGIITNISSTSTNDQGIVAFDVDIRVYVPEGVILQEGLSAIARVAVAEERGIVIPMQSVRFGDQGAFVRKEDGNGEIVEQPVTLGSSDGFFTIVEDGLAAGDRIVMQALDDTELEEGGQFRLRGGAGGGPSRGSQPPQR